MSYHDEDLILISEILSKIYFFLLIILGAKVNALDGLGQTALHRCARSDNVQACRILLTYNIDISIVSLQGYTAAQVATEAVLNVLQGNTKYIDFSLVIF